MPDIYDNGSGVIGNKRFQAFMNQTGATTGRIPSSAILDSIIQSELDAAERRRQANRSFTESSRQFDIGQQNALDTAEANRKAGLVGTGMQAGATGLTLAALTKSWPFNQATTPTPGVGSSVTGLNATPYAPPPGSLIPAAEAFTVPPALNAPVTGMQTLGTEIRPAYPGGAPLPPWAPLPPEPLIDAATTAANIAGEGPLATQIVPVIEGAPVIAEGATLGEAGAVGAEGAGTAAGADAASSSWLGPAGLALAAYQGSRMLGNQFGENPLVGDVLRHPITGVGSAALKGFSKLTGIKEIDQAGEFLAGAEEKLIQQPIDMITSGIGDFFGAVFDW